DVAVAAVAASNDRKTRFVHDTVGRQRFVLRADANGWTVSESRYDPFGNLVESRGYDRHLTDAPGVDEQEVLDQLAALGYHDDTPSTLTNLQRTRFAYDSANQLRF